jgi:hypothetical protein
MQKILNKADKTTYYGETLTVDVKGKPVTMPNGNGRLMNYPYLYVGVWTKGTFTSGQLYIQPNCNYGENFSFEKQNQGERNLDVVLDLATDVTAHGYELVKADVGGKIK